MFLKLTVGYSNARRFVGTRGETRVVNKLPVSYLSTTDLFVPSFVLSLEADDEAVGGRDGLLRLAQVDLDLGGLLRELGQPLFQDRHLTNGIEKISSKVHLNESE